MGLLTFSINLTLDGCVDHQEGIADDETHAFFTGLIDEGGAMLWGRVTYEMMERYWPATCARACKRSRTRPRPACSSVAASSRPSWTGCDLIDESKFLVHPRIAGHGPTLYQSGLPSTRRLELVSATPFGSGAVSMHYQRAR